MNNPHDALRPLEGKIRDLRRAIDLLFNLIYNDGEEEHLRWVIDRLSNDAQVLEGEFDKAWESARTVAQ